ncbi:MAG: glycosyltransferase family 2 protein [Aureliella sp.]
MNSPSESGTISNNPSTQNVDAGSTLDISTAARIDAVIADADELVRSALRPDTVGLTVVVPVYNEPVTAVQIVEKVRQLPISKQVIIVDDGSTDDTAQQIEALREYDDVILLCHEQNRGKGAALQTGFAHAMGDIVIVQDADLEYDPSDILRVIQPVLDGKCKVAYGSRYLDNAKQDPSAFHRFGNAALTWLSNRLTGYKLTDMETCYKAFDRETLQQIQVEQSRFGFEPEITAKLARMGVDIQEVGISYQSRSREEGKKIGWRDLVNAIYCMLRYNLIKR